MGIDDHLIESIVQELQSVQTTPAKEDASCEARTQQEDGGYDPGVLKSERGKDGQIQKGPEKADGGISRMELLAPDLTAEDQTGSRD
jgi:hypothetical protein